MSVYVLDERLWFPPASEAIEDGLLAIGGDLSEERLLLAYRNGIFPWYENNVPLWWSPNPRFVLFPDKLKISKSMQQVLKKQQFTFQTNSAFADVINNCSTIYRKEDAGTWINGDMEKAYINLHKKNYAVSAEAWQDNILMGGLYGIRLGKIFFGESMFSLSANASKFALINYMQQLKKEGVHLVDCQLYTHHLKSLGANMISREWFLQLLKKFI